MPKYDFICPVHGELEVTVPSEQGVPEFCPLCSHEQLFTRMKRIYQPVPVHFRGAGFYKTDNKEK